MAGPPRQAVWALHDFDAQNFDELCLRALQEVRVLEKDDLYADGWWLGCTAQGDAGLFPASFVTDVRPEYAAAVSDTDGPWVRPRRLSACGGGGGALRRSSERAETAALAAPLPPVPPPEIDVPSLVAAAIDDGREYGTSVEVVVPSAGVGRDVPEPASQPGDVGGLASPKEIELQFDAILKEVLKEVTDVVDSCSRLGTSPAATSDSPTGTRHNPPAREPLTPQGNPKNWTINDVCAWLRARGFDAAVVNFEENDITGEILLEMDLTALKELGIASFGKRFNIVHAVNELKNYWSSATSAVVQESNEPPVPVTLWPTADREYVDWAVSSRKPAIKEKFVVAAEKPRRISSLRSPPPSRSRGSAGLSRARSMMSRLLPSITRNRTEFESNTPVLPAGTKIWHRRDAEFRSSFVAEPESFAHVIPEALIESTESMAPVDVGPLSRDFRERPTEVPKAVRAGPDNFRFAEVSCDEIDGSKFFEDAEYAGWLHRRRGRKIKSWQNVWCSSKGGVLYYQKCKGHQKVLWAVQLKGYKVVPDPNIYRGKYCWKAQHESRRTLYFYTDDPEDMRAWVKLLMKASIELDVAAPVVSSYVDKTVPIHVAQAMRPRPPSLCGNACGSAEALRKRSFLLQRSGTSASASSPTTPLSDSAFSSSRASSRSRSSSPPTSASSVGNREINLMKRQSSHGFVGQVDSPARLAFADAHPELRKGVGFDACYEESEDCEEARLQYFERLRSLSDAKKWLNFVLTPRDVRIENVREDLRSGEKLLMLVEDASGHECARRLAPACFTFHMIDNLLVVFRFMESVGVDTRGFTVKDIFSGDGRKIVAMCNAIRDAFPAVA